MKVAAIILCGGTGERFGSDKICQMLGDKPVWKWSVETFRQFADFLVVVDNGRDIKYDVDVVVHGGSTRQKSVQNGLLVIPDEFEWVLIHDGARPFVSLELIGSVLDYATDKGAATAAVRMTDTIRHLSGETLDRDQLWAIQTPQCARREELIRAHQSGVEATDDAALLQAIGLEVAFVESSRNNIKITTPEDMALAKAMVYERPQIVTGMGYDIHALSQDSSRPMMLGGVQFDGPGLEGHSDADALLHAAVDALLGAASMGDIGVHYPPSDPQWKNCPSIRFVEETGQRLKVAGWKVENLDMTLIAETPKIMSRSMEIRTVIATALGIEPTHVNVKATTNEGLGAIGRHEGIAAMAIATLRRHP